jgi:hypothetical protein
MGRRTSLDGGGIVVSPPAEGESGVCGTEAGVCGIGTEAGVGGSTCLGAGAGAGAGAAAGGGTYATDGAGGGAALTAPESRSTKLGGAVFPEKNSPAVSAGSLDGAGGKMSDWN